MNINAPLYPTEFFVVALSGSTNVGIQFPANPGLICFPFHAQAAILPVGGGIVLTNELSLSVI